MIVIYLSVLRNYSASGTTTVGDTGCSIKEVSHDIFPANSDTYDIWWNRKRKVSFMNLYTCRFIIREVLSHLHFLKGKQLYTTNITKKMQIHG